MTILSEMLAQEIDPFRDVGDGGLLFREFQTPFFEKGFHHRPDLVFEELFRVSRNHEVIGESNHVDPVSRKQRFQCPFEPVQGHVAERRRDYASDTMHNFPQSEAGRGCSLLPELAPPRSVHGRQGSNGES